MKKKTVGMIFFLLVLVQTITAQILWNFDSASPSATVANIAASDVTQGNNNGTTTILTNNVPSSGYAGASAGNNAGAAVRPVALNTGASGSAYFEFTLTPNAGKIVALTGISFGTRSTASGPTAYSLRSNLDGFGSDIVSGGISNNSTWALQTQTLSVNSPVGTAITFRIYGHSGSGAVATSTANWRIDDLTLTFNLALPITLISFNAALSESNQTTLKWATANELDNSYFEIERSKNSIDFESLGRIKGTGTSELRNDYSFTDETPLKGINYYRLKQIDFDGTFTYTRPVSVIKEGDGTISLYPNPASNLLKINFEDTDQIENTMIYDLMGKIVKSIMGDKDRFEVSDLPQGKYIIQIRLADSRIISNSFIKN